MSQTCWVLTREHNEYDQLGEYFVAVFKEKPSFNQLKRLVQAVEVCEQPDSPKIDHVVGNLLRKGGGRIQSENKWFFLKETQYQDGDDEL